ncbi:MAG: hypothetical protein WBM00_10660 [Solirubrobacterales bacterium]
MSAARYLLGVAEVGLLGAFALAAAVRLRARLLPQLSGAPACLAAAVLGLALLIWSAQLLGTFGLFEPLPYLVMVGAVGFGTWVLGRGRHRTGEETRTRNGPAVPQSGRKDGDRTGERRIDAAALVALLIAAAAVIHFAAGVRVRLSTGMTGFDSTWYHGPFAAGFFQTADTWALHFIAPQFLAWFYPANGEIFHAIGMLAFDRDILSPLLNLGWFAACLVAAWCIGRPYRVAPASLALAALALSVPALSDQAGEARNDLVAIFFLLAAIGIVLNAGATRSGDGGGLTAAVLGVAGLAVGLAAGTKLNFLIPAVIFLIGLAVISPRGARGRAFGVASLAALAGGGYWYLRNLAHAGNPLPWFDRAGPISLPAPGQQLGGREAHSVLGYATDGSVWSSWFLPGLHHGLGLLWPLLVAAALLGLILALGRRSSPLLRLVGAVGLAALLAWFIAPTSASGPPGMPHGFESGLRYLAPALVLGLALLPTTPVLRDRVARLLKRGPSLRCRRISTPRTTGRLVVLVALVFLLAVAAGYPIQRHYLRNRYASPDFTTPGLDAAFKWARSISDARIATTSTRQYPLFGTDLSNHVQFVGIERPNGGFVAPASCRAWRRTINAGNYDYVVTSRDRVEPGKPAYPESARWTEGPWAKVVLRVPPTVVYQLTNPLNPSRCR